MNSKSLFSVALATLFVFPPASFAQAPCDCAPAYRVECQTVYEEREVTLLSNRVRNGLRDADRNAQGAGIRDPAAGTAVHRFETGPRDFGPRRTLHSDAARCRNSLPRTPATTVSETWLKRRPARSATPCSDRCTKRRFRREPYTVQRPVTEND